MGYHHRDYSVVILWNNNVHFCITEVYKKKKAFNTEVKIKVDLKTLLKFNGEVLFLIYKTDST